MFNRTSQPRYWSPRQRYATCDVLIGLISQGWTITDMQPAAVESRARLYLVTLQRGDDCLSLPVLDGPAIHKFILSHAA